MFVIVTCDPLEVQTGNISADINDEKACFACSDEYKLNGDTCIYCENGNWPDSPSCRERQCVILTIVNGHAESNDNEANISCDNGYELIGDGTVYCDLETETWSSDVRCIPVDCGDLDKPDNGWIILLNGSSTFKSVASLNCHDGFLPFHTETAECLANGK